MTLDTADLTENSGEKSVSPVVTLLGGGDQEDDTVTHLAAVQHGMDAVEVGGDDGHPLLEPRYGQVSHTGRLDGLTVLHTAGQLLQHRRDGVHLRVEMMISVVSVRVISPVDRPEEPHRRREERDQHLRPVSY